MQTKQLHLRLTEDEMSALKGMADQCEVTPTMLGGFFMRAALRAAKAYGHRLSLPPDFEVVEGSLSGVRGSGDLRIKARK